MTKKYPCVGTPFPIEHNGKMQYVPHVWLSHNKGMYAPQRLMYSTAQEANEAAKAAVEKMIKEGTK